MEGFLKVSFARQIRTPEGIAQRVLGVWVISYTTYFNCCSFSLTNPNFRSPLDNQLIFMSNNWNSLFVTIWTRSSFAGDGKFSFFVHIYTVNWRCWFPATVFAVFWKSSSQCLILLVFFSQVKLHYATFFLSLISFGPFWCPLLIFLCHYE